MSLDMCKYVHTMYVRMKSANGVRNESWKL